MDAYQAYMKEVSQPMRQELTENGFTELTTADEVEQFMSRVSGTTIVMINSVCGCAGGLARPAVIHALNQGIDVDNRVTVFAGQDREATEKMREYFVEIPPSSPSIAILQDDKVKHFIPRESIEGADIESVVKHILNSFEA